ncbi:unnamed protein product [Tilletia controversa]|nr:hypothetical protein CF336_g3307 [Tilletia laevis]KAE8205154.1 hypothetical protein CF328_g659 [Tilletia controversa]CAD6891139.1 unnamed protein product [Tilletia caries]KAE8204908.1 hypothetical protein CF335_g2488 [Tilletia laevis]CAD6897440.1 unnamed protein product [Tilletia controversa]
MSVQMPLRRLRAFTLDLVQEADEQSNTSSPGTLRHSDPTTRHLVSSLTKRSKTLADAVAKRRESRSRSSSLVGPAPVQQRDQLAVPEPERTALDAASMSPSSPLLRRRIEITNSPTRPPSIPLPPLPGQPPSGLRSSVPTANTPGLVEVHSTGRGDEALHETLSNCPGDSSSSTGDSCNGETARVSISSTPVNTPRSILRSLPVLATEEALSTPLTNVNTLKTRFAPPQSDEEIVCESSDEELLEDELSQMEHGLVQFQAAFLPPVSFEYQTTRPQSSGSLQEFRRPSSRYETPDSTPTLSSEPFMEKVADRASPDVPISHRQCSESSESSSTGASDISGRALFETRSRGNSISTKASSIENQSMLMQRSVSQGSTLASQARRKGTAAYKRRNSLFVATPPTRVASLENLRAEGAELVRQEFGESFADGGSGEDISLGLIMTMPALPHGSGMQSSHASSSLLGSWLDEGLTRSRPGRTFGPNAGTLSWEDEDDSEDSDEQRFVPVPVRGLHRRFNSADSSIFSINDSVIDTGSSSIPSSSRPGTENEHGEIQDGEGTETPGPFASPLPDQTPTSSPSLQTFLLPSESIKRGSDLRSSSGHDLDSAVRRPYAGLQARAQAKIATSGTQSSNHDSMRSRGSNAGPNSDIIGDFARASSAQTSGARHDLDNQSVSSVAFVYAPTPPVTPMKATASSPSSDNTSTPRRPSTADTLTQSRSPDGAVGMMGSRPSGTFGRAGGTFSTGHSSLAPIRIEGLARTATMNSAASVSTMSRSSSATDRLASGSHAQGLGGGQNASAGAVMESGDIRRSAPSSLRMGKFRTTIFDSFGLKKSRLVDDGPILPSARPLSPAGSAASHSQLSLGVSEGPTSVFGSLMRRTSVTSSQGGGSGSSIMSSAPSSSMGARPHQPVGSATSGPASSPLKRTTKLPDVESMHSATGSVSSKREPVPSPDSHLMPSRSESKHTLRSGPSSATHGTKSTSSSQTSSSSSFERTSMNHRSKSNWAPSDSSIRSGSSRGERSGKGTPSERSRPVRKEEVEKVNAVLAQLQGAGFMAPPKRSKAAKTSKSASLPSR